MEGIPEAVETLCNMIVKTGKPDLAQKDAEALMTIMKAKPTPDAVQFILDKMAKVIATASYEWGRKLAMSVISELCEEPCEE